MKKYGHDWDESLWPTQFRCKKCGVIEYCGCDWMDSAGLVEFIKRVKARRDCECPPGTRLDPENRRQLMMSVEGM